jgi:hypothetical protein
MTGTMHKVIADNSSDLDPNRSFVLPYFFLRFTIGWWNYPDGVIFFVFHLGPQLVLWVNSSNIFFIGPGPVQYNISFQVPFSVCSRFFSIVLTKDDICMFCRSLFVLFYFFFWPLCCLFFDIRIMITHWYLQTLYL